MMNALQWKSQNTCFILFQRCTNAPRNVSGLQVRSGFHKYVPENEWKLKRNPICRRCQIFISPCHGSFSVGEIHQPWTTNNDKHITHICDNAPNLCEGSNKIRAKIEYSKHWTCAWWRCSNVICIAAKCVKTISHCCSSLFAAMHTTAVALRSSLQLQLVWYV